MPTAVLQAYQTLCVGPKHVPEEKDEPSPREQGTRRGVPGPEEETIRGSGRGCCRSLERRYHETSLEVLGANYRKFYWILYRGELLSCHKNCKRISGFGLGGGVKRELPPHRARAPAAAHSAANGPGGCTECERGPKPQGPLLGVLPALYFVKTTSRGTSEDHVPLGVLPLDTK